eukprot:Hpha_TRINITY_DN7529_c0_g1::TRINITY_DN7529_c0_g1_i1::g.19160::m.19160
MEAPGMDTGRSSIRSPQFPGFQGPLMLQPQDPLPAGPTEDAEGSREGLQVEWLHDELGVRISYPLYWGLAEPSEFASELPSWRPRLVIRDKEGVQVDQLLKRAERAEEEGEPEEEEPAEERERLVRKLIVYMEQHQPEGDLEGSSKSPRKDPQAMFESELRNTCMSCLKELLRNPRVVEIDGVSDLKSIRVGEKCQQGLILAGFRAFGFHYSLKARPGRREEDCWRYLIGTYDPRRRATVVVVVATVQQEAAGDALLKYVNSIVCPHLGSAAHFEVFRPQPPEEEPEEDLAYAGELRRGRRERQERGVVRFRHSTAAIAFEIPAYDQDWSRGISLTRAKSHAHILRLIIRLRIHPTGPDLEVPDDSGEAELIAAHRQPVDIGLGLDVEDIVRARHPGILSAADYAALKMRPVMVEFLNTKPNGAPLTHSIGNRSGVSFLWTGNISMDTRLTNYQKVMCSGTVSNNKGVVISFFTKMGQGLFDTNLHIMQDLLKTVRFIPEREADGPFNEAKATTERLDKEEHFRQAFSSREGGGGVLVPRYTFLASCSTAGGAPNGSGHAGLLLPDERGFNEDDDKKATKKKARGKATSAEQDGDSVIDVSDIAHFAADAAAQRAAAEKEAAEAALLAEIEDASAASEKGAEEKGEDGEGEPTSPTEEEKQRQAEEEEAAAEAAAKAAAEAAAEEERIAREKAEEEARLEAEAEQALSDEERQRQDETTAVG